MSDEEFNFHIKWYLSEHKLSWLDYISKQRGKTNE